MGTIEVGELLYEYTVKLTGMTDGQKISIHADGVALPKKGSPIAGLRENVTLFTSSKAYSWVNALQVWGTGTVDLAEQVVHIKGYSA